MAIEVELVQDGEFTGMWSVKEDGELIGLAYSKEAAESLGKSAEKCDSEDERGPAN